MPFLFDCIDEPDWARTSDPLIKSQLLYQLSYRPVCGNKITRGAEAMSNGRRPGQRSRRAAGICLSTTGRAGAFASSEARTKTVRVMFSIFL